MKIVGVNIDCITDENKKDFFVYGIRNKKTNKYYIGSCTNKRGIVDRFRRHIYHLRNNNHHSIKFQRSFNKNNYSFDIWEFILFEKIDKENYKIKEQFYINKFDAYNNGYNSTSTVGVINHGVMSKKHKKAISKSKQNLLDSDIIEIFNKYNNGLKYNEISKYHNLSSPTISNIINKEHYYVDVKRKYNLKKTWYSYIFYNLDENKFYKADNFTKFCNKNNLNPKMMMPLMLGKFNIKFIKNWTVFKRNEFTLMELRNRININNKVHILYKNNVEYRFKSVRDFCKKHNLDETSTYYVLNGNKKSVKDFIKK